MGFVVSLAAEDVTNGKNCSVGSHIWVQMRITAVLLLNPMSFTL